MNISLFIPDKTSWSALPFKRSLEKWLFRYKLYHIPFWCAYHYLFWMIAIGNPLEVASTILFSIYSIKFIFYVVFQAIAVYFNLYFLMPRYLEKSRFGEYLFYLFITIVCTAFLIITGYYLIALISEKSYQELFGVDPKKFYHFFVNGSLASTIASTTLAMSIKLTKNWVQSKRRQQLLEKEKLETELKFLKYQFNPHFLFNSINSIFFLIHKNPDMASDSLAKFSDLLRYQLFECNDNQIPLEKEITSLQNFIELEKLRQNKNLSVTFDITEDKISHLGIAPFILMTFVENAFKHVSKDSDKSNWIKLKLDIRNDLLNFHISNNTSFIGTKDVIYYGGIGLKNVQRRLDLLYPDQHQLDISSNADTFEINLRINLAELVVNEAVQKIA
jgi:two-component system, LytTR family, sensor kinase